MMILRATTVTFLAVSSMLAGTAWAEESDLITLDGLTIRADLAAACETAMKLSAIAANVEAFQSADMKAALDGARVALGFKCPAVEQVMVVGYVGEEIAYGAVSSANSNWTVVEIPAQFAAAAAQPTPPATNAAASTPAAVPPAPAAPAASPTALAAPAADTAASLANLSLPPAPGIEPAQQASAPASPAPAMASTATPPTSASSIEEFAPVQQASTQSRFPYTDYNFAVLMAAIHAGDTDRIPDDIETRKVVFSLLSAISEICGEMGIEVSRNAMMYVSPELGQAMFSNDYDAMAEQGLQILGQMLQGYANGPAGIFDMAEQQAVRVAEGMEDGRSLVRSTGCSGELFRTFQSRLQQLIASRSSRSPAVFDQIAYSAMMSPSFREASGFQDPTVALRERETAALVDGASRSCKAHFAAAGFCDCAIEAVETADLSDQQWRELGSDFLAVARLSQLREPIRTCNN